MSDDRDEYPCLRDDLVDWLRHRGAPTVGDD